MPYLNQINTTSICIRQLFILLALLLSSINSNAQIPAKNPIKINQVGYEPDAVKIAIVNSKTTKLFKVMSADGATVIFNGHAGQPSKVLFGEGYVQTLDFSALHKPGHYKLWITGIGYSYNFRIRKNVYREISAAAMKSYYYQRSGIPIKKEYAGVWKRKEGHPDTTVFIHASASDQLRPEGTVISAARGWYDAGDYNKYIVNSGIATATLLSAYEDFPAFSKTLKLNIPESTTALPDILSEILWNLRWMQRMQDPADGGVYHKLTNPEFDPMIMPDAAVNKRYVVQKSTAATLDLAAVMAQSSRIFSAFPKELPGLADSCLKAAVAAWKWAAQHPDIIYDQERLNTKFSTKISTGPYGDAYLNDERIWAATELFITTKNEDYLKNINLNPLEIKVPSWADVNTLAYYSLIRNRSQLSGKFKLIAANLAAKLIIAADQFVLKSQRNPWKSVMGEQADYIWGSNSVAANQGVLLLKAYQLNHRAGYLTAIQSNIDYLLGKNATGYCFVTGFGTNSPMHPHHRISIADQVVAPVPGLLVAGPNPGQQDHCNYPSTLPDQSYSDVDCAYASNEVAINWNAPLIYLLFGISAMVK